MPEMELWEILLTAVEKQHKEVEKIRAFAKPGSETEPELNEALSLFNTVVLAFLKCDLTKVTFHRPPRKTQQHLIVVRAASSGFTFRIPERVLNDLDGILTQRILNIMDSIQIVNMQAMSLLNPGQPMSWQEFNQQPFHIQREFYQLMCATFGLKIADPLRWVLDSDLKKWLPLEQVKIGEGMLQDNLARLAQKLLSEFTYTEYQRPQAFTNVWLEEAAKFAAARRADRLCFEVKLPDGDNRWGRFSYGIDVISPDHTFSIVNSGSISDERWTKSRDGANWHRYRYSSPEEGKQYGQTHHEKLVAPEFVPYIRYYPEEENGKHISGVTRFFPLDVEQLPTRNGYRYWHIYLPRGWTVRGGSVSYHNEPVTYKAKPTRID